jgi:hypothetical protein
VAGSAIFPGPGTRAEADSSSLNSRAIKPNFWHIDAVTGPSTPSGSSHAAIDHHAGPFGLAGARFEKVEHGGRRAAVLGIAVNTSAIGKPSRLTTRPTRICLQSGRWSRAAALGFGIGGGHPRETGRGEIAEIVRGVEVEEVALIHDESGFDGVAMGVELVEECQALPKLKADNEPGRPRDGVR